MNYENGFSKIEDNKLHLYYFQITDIWQRFCNEYSHLLKSTCDEYDHLLKNDLNKVKKKIINKKKILSEIYNLEKLRQKMIESINISFPKSKIKNISQLIIFMETLENKNGKKHLFNFNKLLLNIIDKIQEQNKKNQLFINKALCTLYHNKQNLNSTLYKANGQTIYQVKRV